jgi:wyosine [tRNA(Phe)-imidazoG37] synthetase (radical SAM superfamily)
MTPSAVYGPVQSRRFGLSLGVDPMPTKRCCFDCVYCQAGRTTELCATPAPGVPPEVILEQVAQALQRGPTPGVITFAGQGEPTLHSGLAHIVRGLRGLTTLPLLLITNGGLLWQDPVLEAALLFDLVAPSLDGGCERTLGRVNRPEGTLDFQRVVGGLRRLAQVHPGQVLLEVMLVRGLNDDDASLAELAALLATLPVTHIDVNTPVRPGPGGSNWACPRDTLVRAAALFGPRAHEVAYEPAPVQVQAGAGRGAQAVLETLQRRPSSVAELVLASGLGASQVEALLADALARGRILAGPGGRYAIAD